jgi:hypothetical protein
MMKGTDCTGSCKSNNDGWTVKCTGTIPQNVYSSLNSIACRPTTGNETVDKEVEISYKICRGKYMLYICIQSILYHVEGPYMGSDVPSVMIPRSMIGAGVQALCAEQDIS